MRVLLDTNVLVSYLLTPAQTGAIAVIIDSLQTGAFTLLIPDELLEELDRVVTHRPHLAGRIRPEQLARLRAILLSLGEVIPRIEQPLPAVTRDRKDDFLLAYAAVGAADFLVTGDDDLLVLQRVGSLQIISPPAFAVLLRSHTD